MNDRDPQVASQNVSRSLLLLLFLVLPLGAWNHLGKPVPVSGLGPMRGDEGRPIKSPFALEAGHLELALTLLSFTHDQITPGFDDYLTDSVTALGLEARIGIVDGLEVMIQAPALRWTRGQASGKSPVDALGPGPVAMSLRLGAPGQHFEPAVALAFIPWVRFPGFAPATGSPGWGFGARIPVEWFIEKNQLCLQVGYGAEVGPTLAVSNSLEGGLAISRRIRRDLFLSAGLYALLEVANPSAFELQADLCASYSFHRLWRIWGAVRIGLTLPSEDAMVRLGLALRL